MARRRIILGLDGSSGADAAREWCEKYAPVLDAEVLAVHVLGFSPHYAELREASWELLNESAALLRARGIEHRTELMDGSPASTLDKLATHENADLIVVGRRGSGGFAELLLGSVAHELAHHAHRPVLIVPAGQHSGK